MRPIALLMVLCFILIGCGQPARVDEREQAAVPPVEPLPAPVVKMREKDGAAIVFVNAGPFDMGSTPAQIDVVLADCKTCPKDWFESERVPSGKAPHRVDLPAYWIDKYEVTNRQYRQFIEAGGYHRRDLWTGEGWAWKEREARTQPQYWTEESWNRPELPVVGVVWYEAAAFCRWAGARLPSEAEWEKAASWNPLTQTKRRFPWGNAWDKEKANTAEKGLRHTTRVGSYCDASSQNAASPYGACDMAGNAWEWCSTLHRPYPYDPTDGREDLEAKGTRTLRGGSWINERHEARTSYRLPPFPGDFILFDPTNGFRCAMDS
jgi:formylglycine-generating enzyme required for sulfatase activity